MLHQGISLLLAPLLILQGLQVRRRTPRLAEPKGKRMGQTGNNPSLSVLILGDSAAAGVGVLRQEEALLGQVVEQLAPFGDLSFNLFAKTGATTASTLQSLEKNLSSKHPVLGQGHFDIIITSLGVNDVTSSISCHAWLEQQGRLFKLLTQRYSPSHIVITAVPPLGLFPALPNPLRWSLGQRALRFNQQLQQRVAELCATVEKTQFSIIELPLEKPKQHSSMLAFMGKVMAADGFHPGAQIYTAWAKRIAEQIQTHTRE
jgi:lysophospholipase L1-like esterase